MNMAIRMVALFVSNPVAVDHRLHDLGWSREDLLEVVDAMLAGRFSCTDNDPISAPGWMAWKEGTRRMREIGRRHGFEISDEDQIPWLIDKNRGRRFSVVSTDDATGLEHRIPQNRNRKGAATDRVVAANDAMLFEASEIPEVLKPLSVGRPSSGFVQSWYLCVYTDGEIVTAELSCPTATEGGYFIDFNERIILIAPGTDGPGVARRGPTEADDEMIDIPVTRKQ